MGSIAYLLLLLYLAAAQRALQGCCCRGHRRTHPRQTT